MPATSRAQQPFMGAELSRKRAGKRTRTKMSAAQLEEFAATKHKGLPQRASKAARRRKIAEMRAR